MEIAGTGPKPVLVNLLFLRWNVIDGQTVGVYESVGNAIVDPDGVSVYTDHVSGGKMLLDPKGATRRI